MPLKEMLELVSMIVLPLGSAMIWGYVRLANKIDKFRDYVDGGFDATQEDLKSIGKKLDSVDQRLSRLEGAFVERGNWEGKLYNFQKNITDRKD